MVLGYKSATGAIKICSLKRLINAVIFQDILYHFLISRIEENLEELAVKHTLHQYVPSL